VRVNYFMGHFKGYFGGVKKPRPPQNILRNVSHKVIFKKIISQIFKISGTLVILCPIATRGRILSPLTEAKVGFKMGIKGVNEGSTPR
jgi:hypothetical protein